MRKVLMFLLAVLLVFIGGCAGSPVNQTRGEYFISGLPEGWNIGTRTRSGNMVITEIVPEGQTVDHWTRMITQQIFLRMTNVKGEQFAEKMRDEGRKKCSMIKAMDGKADIQNGFPIYSWKMTCEINQKTGKPETILLKAVEGKDNFFLLQIAWKYHPDPEEEKKALHYLAEAFVCDFRIPEKKCPKSIINEVEYFHYK